MNKFLLLSVAAIGGFFAYDHLKGGNSEEKPEKTRDKKEPKNDPKKEETKKVEKEVDETPE